ncbi:phospholipase A [Emcibacter sp.]|uniref:phospholipase A n=1 Tax=Emcibacter sp. TaxID=1979954 RepID=UPI002AA76599|nr:phospholipase A [Emcibacter sp.]
MVFGVIRFGRLFYLCFLFLVLGSVSAFADIEKILITPDQPVLRGQETSVTLLLMNNSSDRQEVTIERKVKVYLEYGLNRVEGVLELSGGQDGEVISLEPGNFRKMNYILMVPLDIRPGPLKIIPVDGSANNPFLMVGTEINDRKETQQADVDDDPDKEEEYVVLGPEDIQELKEEKGLFFDNLAPYEPAYILFGGGDTNSKFQISFKYRIFGSDRNELPVNRSWIEGLHFSYTQLNFWDLAAASKPFADTNFKPEFFYLWEDVGNGLFSDNSRVNLQFGFMHESNGRDGENSRSINAFYIHPALTYEYENGYTLGLSARFQAYVGDLSDNPDIIDYRGHSSLVAKFGKLEDFQISAALRGNFETGKGLLMLDFTYPLNKLFINHPDLYFQTQLITGYGEKMLEYDRKETRLRFGIGITR